MYVLSFFVCPMSVLGMSSRPFPQKVQVHFGKGKTLENVVFSRVFGLVAGEGLEPTTSGL